MIRSATLASATLATVRRTWARQAILGGFGAGALRFPIRVGILRTYCLIPSNWTPDECARHTCDDRSHRHLSLREVHALEVDDLVEWIRRPINRRDRGVLRLRRLVIPPARGLSCRVGADLVVAIALGFMWARTMLADIQSPSGF